MMQDQTEKEADFEFEEQPQDELTPEPKEIKKDEKKRSSLSLVIIISAIISGLVGGVIGFSAAEMSIKEFKKFLDAEGVFEQKMETQELGPGVVMQKNGTISVVQEESAVINAVEKASPAVVSIIVTKDVPKLDSYFVDPFSGDPFFNPFGFRSIPEGELETEKEEIGGGTGFIADKEGYIVTNRHVVEDEEAEYSVIMNDGTRFEARVLARDQFVDLAILKVESENDLPTISFGDSESLKIGQTIVAIGNSLGEFRNTVSKGIISGLKRNLSAGDGMGNSEFLDEVIQTDAAINPGNSGGPIINLQGQAVGVNVAMAQGAENIGFAIPINEAVKIYQSVKQYGKIVRPYIGVRYMLVNKQLQEENNLPFEYGALIIRGETVTELAIIPGSPADKAGLTENDIILEVDGKKVTQESDLSKTIRSRQVGEVVTLKVWSKGEEKNLTLTLEESK